MILDAALSKKNKKPIIMKKPIVQKQSVCSQLRNKLSSIAEEPSFDDYCYESVIDYSPRINELRKKIAELKNISLS